jgi:glycosyltransferase involved in cell wall biosynthesis
LIKLALNATSLLSPTTGIAAYTRNLAKQLNATGEIDATYFYSINWSRVLREASLPGLVAGKSFIQKFVPNPYELGRWIQQVRFQFGVWRYRPQLYHDPNFLAFDFHGPTVITVHDLSVIRYPETHPIERVRLMNKHLQRSIEQASQIIVDSQFVKSEVLQHFSVPSDKVHAILLGVGSEYVPRSAATLAPVLAKHALKERSYIFAVGTLEPRKNLIQALDAFGDLPAAARARFPLIIAGMKGWLSDDLNRRLRKHEESGEVRWLGYVSKDELPFLYSGSRMLVYPSLYEGFGLPVLEAMASGVPVITSNRASLPEVAGNAGMTVDPQDRRALRDAMLLLLEDTKEADRRIRLGLKQAARFTWQACAQETLAVYRRALKDVGDS